MTAQCTFVCHAMSKWVWEMYRWVSFNYSLHISCGTSLIMKTELTYIWSLQGWERSPGRPSRAAGCLQYSQLYEGLLVHSHPETSDLFLSYRWWGRIGTGRYVYFTSHKQIKNPVFYLHPKPWVHQRISVHTLVRFKSWFSLCHPTHHRWVHTAHYEHWRPK